MDEVVVTFWRYQLLKFVVGFSIFVAGLPFFFLLAAGAARILPEHAYGLLLLFPILPFIVGQLIATHFVTEKLSRRWSR